MELLVSAYSIMTYFTVPASFLCFILDRNWIGELTPLFFGMIPAQNPMFSGFRCLRVCHLLDIPDFLRVTELAKSRSVLRVVHLSCVVTTILLIGGGIFHLVSLPTCLSSLVGFKFVQPPYEMSEYSANQVKERWSIPTLIIEVLVFVKIFQSIWFVVAK